MRQKTSTEEIKQLESRITNVETRLEYLEINDNLTSQSLTRLWNKHQDLFFKIDKTSEISLDNIFDMVEDMAKMPDIDKVVFKSVDTAYLNTCISKDADIIFIDRHVSKNTDITFLIEKFPKTSQLLLP